MDGSNDTNTPAFEHKELKNNLRNWLSETSSKSACAVGIKNFTTNRRLINPRVYLADGSTPAHPPTPVAESHQAAGGLFVRNEFGRKGSSGVLCYDLSDTDLMVAVFWYVPLAGERGRNCCENKLNIRVLKTGECNEILYKHLHDTAKPAASEVVQDENGYRLCGCMGREPKCMLIIDLYESDRVGHMIPSEPIRGARQLESRLREWQSRVEVKNACGVGINNLSSVVLDNPRFFIYSGSCVYEPAQIVEPQMASASLFVKREFSLLGTSGCMTYDLKDTNQQLALVWNIPLIEAMQENRFYAGLIHRTECNQDLYERLWKESRRAHDGEIIKTEQTYQVVSRMETAPKALFIITLRPKKQWSLW